jgi:hypothetical protein
MSYSIWDADDDAQNAPARQAKTSALKLQAAIYDVRQDYGDFLFASTGLDEFKDRWDYSRHDIRKAVNEHIPPVTGVMNRVFNAMKTEFKRVADLDKDKPKDADPTVPPKDGGDKERTINDDQFKKVKDGDKSVGDEVKTNTGDGSDAEGKDDGFGGKKAPPFGKKARIAWRRRTAGQEGDPDLIPEDNWESYLNSVDQGAPAKVENHDFGSGEDTGSDKHAKRLAVEIYTDWARGNSMRVASLETLEHYGATGDVGDREYHLLANLIMTANDDCDCAKDDSDGDDRDSDGPPPQFQDGGDNDDDSGSDDSDDGHNDDSDESDDDSGEDSSDGSDGGDGESDSDSDSSGDGNPFAGGDDGPPAEDTGEQPADDGPPADAAGPDSGFDAPPGPPDFGDENPDVGSDPGSDPGAPDAAGQTFEVPDSPPELDPQFQDDIPTDDAEGTDPIPPELIDEILGLPQGTVEQLIIQELSGGPDDPSAGGPPPGPPQQLARRKRADASDPSSPVADAGAGGQEVAPAAGPDAPSLAGPTADDGALLDQASQAVTQLVDVKTQQYQQVIDPLQQALQAIQFAQQVEQAENPLDVTPPGGTVDVGPASAAPDPTVAAPGAPAPPPPAPPAAPVDPNAQKAAYRIARAFNVTPEGYEVIMAALSRKHYQHVAEAIQTLPPEHRTGIAASLADMFGQDNARFNSGQFLQSAGVDPHLGSRRPFVSSTSRQGGETWQNTPEVDGFEFPNPGKPKVSDNMKVDDLPALKTKTPTIAGVADEFGKFEQHRTEKGLGYGGETDVHDYIDTHKGVGPRAKNILHQSLGLQPEPTAPKVASFFTPKVAGWNWDDHLNGYVTAKRQPFTCTTAGCGQEVPTPSYGTCRCGKIWNTYAIGDDKHLASGDAEMYIAREIPVRDGVIMANRKMAGEDEEFNNASGDGERQDYAEDIEFHTDDELENSEKAHSPGETDNSGSKTAYTVGDDDHTPVTRDGEKFCSGCNALLWDPSVHHCPAKQASTKFADWTVYDDDSNKGYDEGPDGPPSTKPKGTTDDWAKRGPEKGPASQWAPPTFQKRK